MNDLATWVMGWNEVGNEHLAEKLRNWGGVPNVFTYTNYAGSEAENGNHAFKWSEEHGFKYILTTDADVDFIHRETIPKLYEFITSNYAPKIGSVRPWRKGEPAQSAHYPPEKKYVEDGTGVMWRLIGAYYDAEFLYTGWIDLDLGEEYSYRGWEHYNDRRYPVMHDMTGSNSHNRSSLLNAAKKRNKLILDYKWYMCGRDKWQGVEAFNVTLPVEKRVPTINQLVCYSNEEQEQFAQSISPEHHQIWVKDHHENPNLVWANPCIVGYSTRERFEAQYGYS